MDILYIVAGIAILILGRKLFWLFVGGIGFILGITLIPRILPGQSETIILTLALVAGLLGALLSLMLQKFAVGLAGFIAGGYIVYYLVNSLTMDVGQYYWLALIAGGILGAILAGSMFDWALILLSSASGAMLITQSLGLPSPMSIVVVCGLFIIGILIQGNIKQKE